MPLVLSLFPGIGLLDMAFEEVGFTVVRGPDVLWGGDIKRFHVPSGKFDGVIGGPPCQFASRLRHIVEANGYEVAENLIPEYERVVREAQPYWFVMENVQAAPEPSVEGYAVASVELNNRWLGEVQHRLRRFSFGVRGETPLDPWASIDLAPLESSDWAPAVCASGGYRHTPVAVGGSGKRKRPRAISNAGFINQRSIADAMRLQGLPEDFLAKAPFTAAGKQKVLGNGVPLPMGRTIAKAVARAVYGVESLEAAS